MASIADACAQGVVPAEIVLVISDNADAGILTKAEQRKIPSRHLNPGDYRTKLDEQAEKTCINALKEAEVDLVVLAGFMRILKGNFLRAFTDRVVNIHPSLLPSFPGLEAWKQALEYGVKVTGCTVHLVDQGIDTGPILAQETVPVLPDDTADSLHERIQEAERVLYPTTLAKMLHGGALARGKVWAPEKND